MKSHEAALPRACTWQHANQNIPKQQLSAEQRPLLSCAILTVICRLMTFLQSVNTCLPLGFGMYIPD